MHVGGAGLLIATGLLSLAPLAILGPAIGWPASLGAPAATQLAAIAKAPGAVAMGYGVYLLYSILILPAVVLMAQKVFGGLGRPLAQLVVAFAALSVMARCIGILRWLTVMPDLAVAHAGAGPADRQTIELVFQVISTYGGGIGEMLGVALFMAVAVLGLAYGGVAQRSVPHGLSALGLVSALLLLGLFLPTVGVAIDVPVALAVTMLSVWMWAFAGWLLWIKNKQQ